MMRVPDFGLIDRAYGLYMYHAQKAAFWHSLHVFDWLAHRHDERAMFFYSVWLVAREICRTEGIDREEHRG